MECRLLCTVIGLKGMGARVARGWGIWQRFGELGLCEVAPDGTPGGALGRTVPKEDKHHWQERWKATDLVRGKQAGVCLLHSVLFSTIVLTPAN